MLISILLALAAHAAIPADVAFEKLAYRLELVRNQIELTISNHKSLAQDLLKQQRELAGMRVFDRVPLASSEPRTDKAQLGNLRSQLDSVAEKRTGFRVRSLHFGGPWQSAPRTVPKELPFDTEYRVPDDQVVDRRDVVFEIDFDKDAPLDPAHWFREQQELVRRLFVPKSWKRAGRRLTGRAWIYRFRDLEYPKMLAPDLSRYNPPAGPSSQVQKAAYGRIRKYREEIVRLWPRCQPYLDTLRQFAVNDLRMNFYLEHDKLLQQ